MRDDERVDPAHPLVPEHAGHGPPRRGWRPQPAGIVDEAPPRRAPDHNPTAVAHRRHHDPHSSVLRAAHSGVLKTAQPRRGHTSPAHDHPCRRHHPPGADAGEPLPRHDEHHHGQQQIPSRHPPGRRPGHPPIPAGQARGPTHHRADALQRAVAGPATSGRQRGRHRRRHETEKPPRHRQRHQRRDQGIEYQSHRTDEVKR